jgi:hypothetical protein
VNVAQSALAGFGLRDALLGGTSNAEPSDRLVAALREREAPLVLDSCEHVIESAAAFAHRVLGECPRLRILATSREPLGITGEALWLVEPLAVPEEDSDPARSSPRRPSDCCATGRARGTRTSRSTPTRWRRWCGSAGRWTGCRWRSNWPRRGCAPCPSISSPSGSTTDSGC